jgi:hypothetical protein
VDVDDLELRSTHPRQHADDTDQKRPALPHEAVAAISEILQASRIAAHSIAEPRAIA